MINFNVPLLVGNELDFIKQAIEGKKLCGNGPFTKKAEAIIREELNVSTCLLMPSCTDALELSAMLIDIQSGDEVIVPSFTFVSTALAFVSRGATIRYVDINPKTLNLDENLIEKAVTKKTKAIVPVHYAGVSCAMDEINQIANKHKFYVIEDAAQGVGAKYKGLPLGSLGDMATFSYHETKNINCGEGGCLIVKSPELANRAEILREKGTNRKQFLAGVIDKYTWVDIGSSFLMNEFTAAFLYAQLLKKNDFLTKRLEQWDFYYKNLTSLQEKGVQLPFIPEYAQGNAHIFYLITRSAEDRQKLQNFLLSKDIQAVPHYVPLHSSTFGRKTGVFIGEDRYTTDLSSRLIRLPLHNSLRDNDLLKIVEVLMEYYK